MSNEPTEPVPEEPVVLGQIVIDALLSTDGRKVSFRIVGDIGMTDAVGMLEYAKYIVMRDNIL